VADESILVQLLERARAGDDAARDELFSKCRNYVAVVARAQVESWLQAKVDPSDLVQVTMLEAYQGFRDFRGQTPGEWLAWLRKLLLHNATDYVRQYGGTAKRAARRETPLAAALPGQSTYIHEPADSLGTPSQLVMAREQEILLADALTRLPADYQEVIQLRNLQRLPFDEVARRMNRSRPAAQMLWMRALRSLAQALEPANDA
jgi:RNA polymerase sigma-70 factor (ECF subfamily)